MFFIYRYYPRIDTLLSKFTSYYLIEYVIDVLSIESNSYTDHVN